MTSNPTSSGATADRRLVLLGILCAIAGSATLSLNDLFIKLLSGAYPLHEVILVRGLIGIVFILGFAWATGQGAIWRTSRPGFHLGRAMIVMVSNATYFLGLAALPIADAAAIGFIAPILLTLLSVLFLGERVGLHRWGAVILGLAGVIVMLNPEGRFRWEAVLVLVSALTYATTQTMTRSARATEGAATINFHTQVAFIVTSVAMGLWAGDGHMEQGGAALEFLFRPWVWPDPGDLVAFAGTGISVAAGGMLMAQAYRMNEAALVAPFEYTSMPLAVIWGLLIFGTFPDARGWLGIVLIVGAGLYTLMREGMKRRPQAEEF
ncbi:DMT family transporter [Stagnihabitans tardus]|uniref:EamA family transporter n=1 Tax=Stagnihabitans tardus TaxID=2699202 RepID=A0AAE5BU43_9RHOB|nr:DMT family transporter [Stagnihabitans tardus]NBZ87396.1 EamA family transporter [Stagnihabitans tardus]